MKMTINKFGKPHFSVKGPTLVNPLRKVHINLCLGVSQAPVTVRLQQSKQDWRPKAA